MNRREGFTVIELLVTLVLAGLIMGSAYQVVLVQQRSTRAQTILATQRSALRTAAAVLQTELREAASFSGSADAGSDLGVIAGDSVRFRALRQFAVVCDLNRGDHWLDVWVFGDRIAKQDSIMAYAEGNTSNATDDVWKADAASSVGAAVTTSCNTSWPGVAAQGVNAPGIDLTGVYKGGVVRGFKWITYGLVQSGGEWVLKRWTSDGTSAVIAEGLDAASSTAPLFRYYDSNGTATTDAGAVAQIEIVLRSPGNAGAGVPPETLSTRLYLRNN
ncbi:MAG TPA: prepilin-type N-terminal cleavage/methylation domain-containing protein [Longimicrobiales bacterium]|nr:prepilin-type N-terminal cleavage/methylation domain-containing protein [Longimicrobiales bacterium]